MLSLEEVPLLAPGSLWQSRSLAAIRCTCLIAVPRKQAGSVLSPALSLDAPCRVQAHLTTSRCLAKRLMHLPADKQVQEFKVCSRLCCWGQGKGLQQEGQSEIPDS